MVFYDVRVGLGTVSVNLHLKLLKSEIMVKSYSKKYQIPVLYINKIMAILADTVDADTDSEKYPTLGLSTTCTDDNWYNDDFLRIHTQKASALFS